MSQGLQKSQIDLIDQKLKSTTPQNLMLSSSVNFVTKSFYDFTLYDNIKTRNMPFLSRRKLLNLTIALTKWIIRIPKRSCVPVNISLVDSWKGETQSIQLRNGKSQRNSHEREAWAFFNELKYAAKLNLAFKFIVKNENTVRLLRYNYHICYGRKFNAVFQSFRCPNCDTFFNRAPNLERHITKCSEQ